MKEATSEIYRALRQKFRGELLRPDDPQYEPARGIWNAMVARRASVKVQRGLPFTVMAQELQGLVDAPRETVDVGGGSFGHRSLHESGSWNVTGHIGAGSSVSSLRRRTIPRPAT